jgi:hypothetical protein
MKVSGVYRRLLKAYVADRMLLKVCGVYRRLLKVCGVYRRRLKVFGVYRRLLKVCGVYRRLLKVCGFFRRLLKVSGGVPICKTNPPEHTAQSLLQIFTERLEIAEMTKQSRSTSSSVPCRAVFTKITLQFCHRLNILKLLYDEK